MYSTYIFTLRYDDILRMVPPRTASELLLITQYLLHTRSGTSPGALGCCAVRPYIAVVNNDKV